MNEKVWQALSAALHNWKAMSGAAGDTSESTAETFEASFYLFIDAVREWTYGLDQQPETLEAFMALSMIQQIVDLLPAPLQLNFETEAEWIVEHKQRIDEDQYD
jgi:hypothetical protein